MKQPIKKPPKGTRGMQGFEIAFELRRRGLTQVDVAKRLNVKVATVSNVVNGHVTSFRVASHLAKLIGKSVNDIWPDRYVFKPRRRATGPTSG